MFDNPALLTAYITAAGFVIGLILTGFKGVWWAGDQFKEGRALVYNLVKQLEDKFDKRHEDNIERFAKLETKLDVVIKNGH